MGAPVSVCEQGGAAQANFHCQTCMLCGMTYAPGEEADEKLHAAHHAKLVQGIRFHVSSCSIAHKFCSV